jgi:NAD-specific glutamate dehydrogenase
MEYKMNKITISEETAWQAVRVLDSYLDFMREYADQKSEDYVNAKSAKHEILQSIDALNKNG